MEGRPIERLARQKTLYRLPILVAVVLLVTSAVGCMGGAWENTLAVDTPQAYHQFVRKYPDSEYVAEAKERIAFHKVKRRPTLQRYETFRKEYPESRLLVQLHPLIESQAFDAARAAGTVDAFRSFADSFAGGAFAARAEGNAVYLEADGFAGQPEALRDFARSHPDSDFAAEASRTLAALDARSETAFRRVGLVVEIAPSTPEEKRLTKAFIDRAKDAYEKSGLELMVIPEIAPRGAPSVRLTIRHSEEKEKAEVSSGGTSKSGYLARTVVTLQQSPESEPIFERAFDLHLGANERIPNNSMLFASKQAKLYWDQFFVPVASWQSTAAVRPPLALDKKATAVDAVIGRAVVLFNDGDFHLLSIADPQKPALLARYDRESKLERFEGVEIVGNKVLIFGQDGLELVGFGPRGPEAVGTFSRGEVGSVSALVSVPSGLLLASSKGLLFAEEDGSNAERVMRRVVHGLDAYGETLIFADDDSVFISTLPMLRQNRVVAQLRLGRTFKPERVRVVDQSAVVIGQAGIVVIDLANPAKPKVVSKVARKQLGSIGDAARVGDEIFLLGARGIQLMDDRARRVVEVVDVAPRERVARTGRHLVLVGEQQLQVVDALPFAASGGRARPASSR